MCDPKATHAEGLGGALAEKAGFTHAEGYYSKAEGFHSIAIGHMTELEKLQCPVCNPESWEAFKELP